MKGGDGSDEFQFLLSSDKTIAQDVIKCFDADEYRTGSLTLDLIEERPHLINTLGAAALKLSRRTPPIPDEADISSPIIRREWHL